MKAAAELPPEYVRPAVGISPSYWCFRPNGSGHVIDQIRKTRNLAVHATLPLLVSVELEQKITPSINLWNYDLHQLLWSKTCSDVYHDASAESTKKYEKTFKKAFVRSRSDQPEPSVKFYSVDFSSKVTEDVPVAKGAVGSGVIRDVKFLDFAINLAHEAVVKDIGLVVLGDTFVIIYYCSTNTHTVITSADLGKKTPSSTEMLADNKLLIGCTDGTIKLWNISHHTSELIIQALPKTDIANMRLVPPKLGDEGSNASDKARVVVVGADGNAVLCTAPFTDAPVKLGDGVLAAQDIFIDRENQTLLLANSDHKLSLWDLSESGLRSDRPASRTVNSGRRASAFAFKRTDSMSSMKSVASHGAYKLDKSMPVYLNKLTGLAVCYDAHFPPHTYFMCSHTHALGIVQNKSGQGDDSEAASNVAGADKATRLQLLHDINVQQLLVAYANEKLGVTITAEQLNRSAVKIYQVLTSPARPRQVMLATSYGPLVLDLSLKHGPHAGRHNSWGDLCLTSHDNYIKLIRAPAFDSPLYHAAISAAGGNQILDSTEMTQAEKRIDATSFHNLPDLFTASRSYVYPSPSGKYCAFHWPDAMVYVVVNMSNGSSSNAIMEVDRGHAVEFGWVAQDHFFIKQPAHFLVSEQKRRSSMFAFKSNAPVAKTFKPSTLVMKQMVSGSAVEVKAGAKVGDLGSDRVIEMFSGTALCVNFIPIANKDVSINEEGGQSKQLLASHSYSQFHCWAAGSMSACSPVMDRVEQLSWDYERGVCTAAHVNKLINIYHLSGQSMQAVLTMTSFNFDHPLSIGHLDNLLVLSCYRSLQVTSLVPQENHEIKVVGQVQQDSFLQVHDVLRISHSHVLLLHRDGSLRLLGVEGSGDGMLGFFAGLPVSS